MIYNGKKTISPKLQDYFGKDEEVDIIISNLASRAMYNVEDESGIMYITNNDRQGAFNLVYEAIMDGFEHQSFDSNELGIIAAEAVLKHHGFKIDHQNIMAPDVYNAIVLLQEYNYKLKTQNYDI